MGDINVERWIAKWGKDGTDDRDRSICPVCGKVRKAYSYGSCRRCHNLLYGPDSEDLPQ